MIPSISIGCLSLHTVPLHVCSHYWKSYVDLISEWRLSYGFFSLLLWQGSTPNELWLYTLLFILCWTHRLKENEMNEHVQLLSISFHSFYHFHHSFSLFNRILKVRVQHTRCCTHAQQWRKTINSQIPCLKLITSGNKSHYDKWISLQKPMDSIVSKFYLETKWSINHFRMAAHCANPNPCIHAKKNIIWFSPYIRFRLFSIF